MMWAWRLSSGWFCPDQMKGVLSLTSSSPPSVFCLSFSFAAAMRAKFRGGINRGARNPNPFQWSQEREEEGFHCFRHQYATTRPAEGNTQHKHVHSHTSNRQPRSIERRFRHPNVSQIEKAKGDGLLGAVSTLFVTAISYLLLAARSASYPIPIITTATRERMRPGVERTCHWRKTMQRFFVFQVKSILYFPTPSR